MFRAQEVVYCPVGKHTELGYRTKGKSATLMCKECGFIFPIDEKGEFLTPIKIDKRKLPELHLYCGPDGCICH